MTAVIVMSCDGHRSGQRCRGARPSATTSAALARREAHQAGWRITPLHPVDLCPSGGHDEDQPR